MPSDGKYRWVGVGTMNPLVPNLYEIIVFYVLPVLVVTSLVVTAYRIYMGAKKHSTVNNYIEGPGE